MNLSPYALLIFKNNEVNLCSISSENVSVDMQSHNNQNAQWQAAGETALWMFGSSSHIASNISFVNEPFLLYLHKKWRKCLQNVFYQALRKSIIQGWTR